MDLLELQVLLLVIVDEAGDGVVMAAGEHACGGLLFLDYSLLLVYLVVPVGPTKGASASGDSIEDRCLLTFLGVNRLLVRVRSVASL